MWSRQQLPPPRPATSGQNLVGGNSVSIFSAGGSGKSMGSLGSSVSIGPGKNASVYLPVLGANTRPQTGSPDSKSRSSLSTRQKRRDYIRMQITNAIQHMFPFYLLLVLTVIGVALGASLSPFTCDKPFGQTKYIVESSVAAVFVTLPLLVDIALDMSFGWSLYAFGDSKHNFRVGEKLCIFIGCVFPPVYFLIAAQPRAAIAQRQIQCALFSCAIFSILRRKLLFLHHAGAITMWDIIPARFMDNAPVVFLGSNTFLGMGRIVFAAGGMHNVGRLLAVILLSLGATSYSVVYFTTLIKEAPNDVRKSTVMCTRVHNEYVGISTLYGLFIAAEVYVSARCVYTEDNMTYSCLVTNLASVLFCLGVFVYSVRTMKFDVVTEKMQLESHRSFARFISHELRTPLTTG
jgi:hypothetical protein